MYAPKLLSNIIGFPDAIGYGDAVQKRVQNTIKEAQDVISGQKAMDDIAKGWETAKSMIPGSAIVSEVADKVKILSEQAKSKKMEESLKASGVDDKTAKAAADQYFKMQMKERQMRMDREKKQKEDRKNREKMRNDFNNYD